MNVNLDTLSTDVLVFYNRIHKRIKNTTRRSLLHDIYTSKNFIKTEVALFLLDDEKYVRSLEVQEYSYQERCQALAAAIENTTLSTAFAMDEFIASAKHHLNKKIFVDHVTPDFDVSKHQSTQDLVLGIAGDPQFSENRLEVRLFMKASEISFSNFMTSIMGHFSIYFTMTHQLGINIELESKLARHWSNILDHPDPIQEHQKNKSEFKKI